MFWHIETDFISLLVMAALYMYVLRETSRRQRDMQMVKFLWCLLSGIVVSVVDIAASIAMEAPVSRFVYHLLMTLYFTLLEISIVFWFRYCLTILYHDDEKSRWKATRMVEASYIVYALFALSNPWTGAIYTLGPNNEYNRGPLFFLMTGVYVLYALALFVVVLRRRKHMPLGYPPYPLLMTPVIVGASVAAQLLNPGWLMILPGYMLSLLSAYLFLQTRRAREKEAGEQMGLLMNSIGSGVCVFRMEEDGAIRVLLANPVYYAMFGYTKEQFEREISNPLRLIHPDDQGFAAVQIAQVFAQERDVTFEFRVKKRDGSLRHVRCQSSMAAIPGLGKNVLLATLSDITDLKAAEETARVHEKEMRLAMAQMGRMICEYNLDTGVLVLPDAYAKRFGLPTVLSGVPGNAQRSGTILPAFLPAYRAFHEAIRRGDVTGGFDFQSRWADGSIHWEQANFHSIFDSDGKPVKAIIAVEDATEERRRFELEQSRPTLGEANLLIHALFNLNTGAVLDYAYRDGRTGPQWTNMDDFLREEVLRDQVINQAERAEYRRLNRRKQLLERFENGETEISFDYRRRMQGDDVIWVRNILRMVREPGGSDVLLFEYCYNIEAEKTYELMYGALVNENFDFVGRINGRNRHYSILISGDIIGAMPPAQGDDVDEVVRSIALPSTHPDDREAMLACINVENIIAQLEKSDRYRFTSRLIYRDGTVHYKTLNMYYLDRERQIIIMTREDVSDAVQEEMRKNQALTDALQAAERANLAKSRFLSRMSHELRTPMNAILGVAALAGSQAQDPPPYMLEACNTINESGQYLLSLINDILEVSRIENGKLALKNEPFSLWQLLETVRGMVHSQARDKELTYVENVSGDGPEAYLGDAMKLRQILTNLLDNAVKFTPPGGRISLDVGQTPGRKGSFALRFSVEDNGAGIEPDFLPHIFELFTQESMDNTSTVTGTGLGLPIVKNLVELMDGSIQASSVKGRGSVFTFEVELAPAREGAKTAAVPRAAVDLRGRRILSVEDNRMNAMILMHLLENAGAEACAAYDGQEGVEVFNTSPSGFFDAILMDIRMPVMDGLTAAKTIRGLKRPDSGTVPIIAVSANAFDEDVELSLECGMNAHLAKPIDPQQLFATLVQLME